MDQLCASLKKYFLLFPGYLALTLLSMPEWFADWPWSQLTAFFGRWSDSWVVITFQNVECQKHWTTPTSVFNQRDTNAGCKSLFCFTRNSTEISNMEKVYYLVHPVVSRVVGEWPFCLNIRMSKESLFKVVDLYIDFRKPFMSMTTQFSSAANKLISVMQVHAKLTKWTQSINLHMPIDSQVKIRVSGQRISLLELCYNWTRSNKIYYKSPRDTVKETQCSRPVFQFVAKQPIASFYKVPLSAIPNMIPDFPNISQHEPREYYPWFILYWVP